jgi:5-methylthioadenosine/S-adenosylhomocysteine deaminase
VAYLDELEVLGRDTLVIHGVQVNQADISSLARRGCAVALCPRSNERHGHGRPPVDRYLEAGVPVGLGTDSVASVESVDLFAEARAAARCSTLGPAAVIGLMTLDGARVLGLDAEVGSLDAGKAADLCLLAVPPAGSPDAMAGRMLEAGSGAVRATWLAGRLVAGRWPDAG